MKKGLKKYFLLALKGQLLATIIVAGLGIKATFADSLLWGLKVSFIFFLVSIPFNLVASFVYYRFFFSERAKKDNERAKEFDRFLEEITKEAKANNIRKYLSNRIFFGVILIIFVLLPFCWYLFKRLIIHQPQKFSH